jgi:hypothetical protein
MARIAAAAKVTSEAPADDRVRRLVRRRIAELRLSLSEVSLALGRNHAYLQQFLERGTPREIPERIRPGLAALLQVDETALRDAAAGTAASLPRGRGVAGERRPVAPSPTCDLPVYAGAQGGPTGMQVLPEPIDWVSRPRPLENVAKAFAVYVVGDSMEPAYRHGDLVFVHPALPALRGDDVLLTRQGEDREMVALIKHLAGWNERHWKLKQWNPEREIHLGRGEWRQVQVIVGKYNRR